MKALRITTTVFTLALLLLAVATTLHAQTTYQITAQGGTVNGPIIGRPTFEGFTSGNDGKLLITSYTVNGTTTTGTNLGTIGLITGGYSSGSYQVGASLLASTIGPDFTVDIPGGGGIIFNGQIAPAAWNVVIAQPGARHYYTLSANLSDTMHPMTTGNFVLTTGIQGTAVCFWNGSATVESVTVNLTIQ